MVRASPRPLRRRALRGLHLRRHQPGAGGYQWEGHDVFVRDRRLNPAASADLALAVTATPDPVRRGKTLTYAFTLTNRGPDRATGTSLLVVLSSHLLVTTVTPSQGDCHPAHVLVCRLGLLPQEKRRQ